MMLTGVDSMFPLAASWLLASVLLHAGLAKAGRPRALASALRDEYRITIQPRLIAVLLPWSEIALAILLVVAPSRGWVAWATALLLGAFTAILLKVRWQGGVTISCSCFGMDEARWPIRWLLLRNAGLLLVTVYLLLPQNAAVLSAAPPAILPGLLSLLGLAMGAIFARAAHRAWRTRQQALEGIRLLLQARAQDFSFRRSLK
jgi:Methylamine utilisation protein MauE